MLLFLGSLSSFGSLSSGMTAHAATTGKGVKATKVIDYNADNTNSKNTDTTDSKSDSSEESHGSATKDKKSSANENTENVKDAKSNSNEKKKVNKFKTVTVKSGDTTWKIAKKNSTTVQKIIDDNHLKNNGNLIFVDEKLKVRANDNESNPGKGLKNTGTSSKNKVKRLHSYLNTSASNNTSTSATASNSNSGYQSSQNTNSGYNSQVSQAPKPSYSGSYQSSQNTNTGIQKQSYTANTQSQNSRPSATSYTSNATGSEKAAKEWIASRESGGSYTAVNSSSGAYGRYQLLPSYLHGDYSAANQERTADNYVKGRYGSWQNAKNFWQANGWY